MGRDRHSRVERSLPQPGIPAEEHDVFERERPGQVNRVERSEAVSFGEVGGGLRELLVELDHGQRAPQ